MSEGGVGLGRILAGTLLGGLLSLPLCVVALLFVVLSKDATLGNKTLDAVVIVVPLWAGVVVGAWFPWIIRRMGGYRKLLQGMAVTFALVAVTGLLAGFVAPGDGTAWFLGNVCVPPVLALAASAVLGEGGDGEPGSAAG